MLRQVLVDALRTRQRIAHARGARMLRALKRCLYSQKSNNNGEPLPEFFEVGVSPPFVTIEAKRGPIFDAPLVS